MTKRNPDALTQKRRAIIAAYMEKQGIETKKLLAERLGIRAPALNNMVRGARPRFSADALAKVLRHIGVSVDEWGPE